MAAIFFADAVMDVRFFEWMFGEDGDAVVAFHACEVDVFVSGIYEGFDREMLVRGFCFLKANNVWRSLIYEVDDKTLTQPDRINIPCDEAHKL